MVVKKLQDLLLNNKPIGVKMEINELDENLIPDYLIDENSYLESTISNLNRELKENNKKIESILNLKNISRDDIKTIKTESYAKVARLISYCRVSEPNSIFYFYNGDDKELTRIDAIKCSDLPKYKDNFEIYELAFDKIKTMISDSGEGNLYYIKGFISNKEFNIDTSSVTCIGTMVCTDINVMSKIES